MAVQAEHTVGGNASMSTTYKKLTAEEIGAMNLNSMEALWDHKISIRNAASYPEKVGTATDGSYGFESFYTMNWYQSHNDSGSPDTHSFKRLDRYREVAQKLGQIPYFDKDAVIAQFKAAFEADTVNGNTNRSFGTKRMIYGMIKRVTGDFENGGIYESPAVIPVTSAEELVQYAAQNPYGYYRLEQDIDFTNVTASGGSYIPGRFIGVVDGNGHSVTDLTIWNDGNQVGGLAGTISNSEFRRISAEDLSIRSNNTIGGIAGQFDGRILEDGIVTGVIEGTSRHQMGARIGGITGWQGGGIMRRVATKVSITAPDPDGMYLALRAVHTSWRLRTVRAICNRCVN